jgi:hypothetical protein
MELQARSHGKQRSKVVERRPKALRAAKSHDGMYAAKVSNSKTKTHGARVKSFGSIALRALLAHGAFGASSLLLLACGSSLPEPPAPKTNRVPVGASVEVPYPPPPARVEFIPDKPASGAVWIDGEWTWTGRRWAWNYGKWLRSPAGATFAPWKTFRASDGALLYVAGIWRNAKGAEIVEPEPLATGRAREENVPSPEGEPIHTAPNRSPAAAPAAH